MKKEYPDHTDLFCFDLIMNSHDDFSIVEDLYAGFDEDFRLVVICRHTDYDESYNNSSTYAFVDKEEAYKLSKALGCSLRYLPSAVSARVAGWIRSDFATPGQVRECFSDVVNFLQSQGAHPRIAKKRDAGHDKEEGDI